jgi:putative phosphoribosyl transferase
MKVHYFASREQAGTMMAPYLMAYRNQECTVLAVSPGGLMIGAEIARHLHATLSLLMTRNVYLPGGKTLLGIVDELGGFTFNKMFTTAEIEEFEQEYRASIDAAKMEAMQEMHHALGAGGILPKRYFRRRNVIVVTDFALNGLVFEAAAAFLKTVHTKKIIMGSPVATVKAIDRMHILADQIVVMSVTEQDFGADHYFEDNTMPPPGEVMKIINNNILKWYTGKRLPAAEFNVTKPIQLKQSENSNIIAM